MTCEEKVVFDSPQWKNYSKECMDLITKLLIKNPENRITLTQVLQHPWFDKLSKDFDKEKGALSPKGARERAKANANFTTVMSPTRRK